MGEERGLCWRGAYPQFMLEKQYANKEVVVFASKQLSDFIACNYRSIICRY